MTKYLDEAQEYLLQAKKEFDSGDDKRLSYAILRLRMTLEALIYDRLSLYQEELSNEKLDTWQPDKVLKLLLEIDPYAGTNTKMSISSDNETFHKLGEQKVLSLKEIKNNYHALGNYLHTPTLKQQSNNKRITKMKKKYTEVYKILDTALSTTLRHRLSSYTISINCTKCQQKIYRKVPWNYKNETLEVDCYHENCTASYRVTVDEEGSKWEDKIKRISCAQAECKGFIEVWDNEFKETQKHQWRCTKCQSIYKANTVFVTSENKNTNQNSM
ncbi:MAG: hypothetical protein U9N49_12290 [Campylobacterota bacterium]|nr:hypothetical protein [Campylobacterota bacterium]